MCKLLSIALAIVGISLVTGCGERQERHSEPFGAAEGIPARAPALPTISADELSSVVWLGDSITHRVGFTQYLETFFVTRYPERELRFLNRGVAGDRAGDVLLRYADDEAARGALLAVIQLGMNDGGYRRWQDETGEIFSKDLQALLERVRASGSAVVLVSPTFYDVEAEWRDQLRDGEPLRSQDEMLIGYDAVVARLGDISRGLAEQQNLPYADIRSPLLAKMLEGRTAGSDVAFSLVPDSLHPSADGHAIMAVTILREAFSLPKMLSEVKLSKSADGSWQAKAEGAEVVIEPTDADEQVLSFSKTARSLPWLLPEAAMSGFLAAGGEQCNAEILQVAGLDAGRHYLLSIDDYVAGSFSAEALVAGVNVGAVSGTPQRVQAAGVAELNRLRNEGPVQSRQDWQVDWKNRSAAIKLAEAETAEGAEKEAQQAEFDLWAESYRQAVIDLQADQEKRWEQLHELAQPQKRRYVLRVLPEGYRPFAGGD